MHAQNLLKNDHKTWGHVYLFDFLFAMSFRKGPHLNLVVDRLIYQMIENLTEVARSVSLSISHSDQQNQEDTAPCSHVDSQ